MTLSHKSVDITQLLENSRERVEFIRIRSFKAIDDLDSCMKFQEGHLDVLRSFGFQVSSSKEDWMTSEFVHVVIVESEDGRKIYGGARIEEANKGRPLPVQSAISYLDPKIDEYVNQRAGKKFGELCGLWNSVAVAGLGIGSVYSIRSALAVATRLGFDQILALCSVHSFKMASNFGFSLVKGIGENGILYYEGAKQNAHITIQDALQELANSDENEKLRIQSLSSNPNQIVEESRNKVNLTIEYSLSK
ncbi:MAG: hypothetical protein RLY35_67 [Bacteroidota bacterium]